MNWQGLITEHDGKLELLSFQGRAIAFDLDSEIDRERLGDLDKTYRLVRLGPSLCPMPATEWYLRQARGEHDISLDAQPTEEGPPAMQVCQACARVVPDADAPPAGTDGVLEGPAVCAYCRQPLPPAEPVESRSESP